MSRPRTGKDHALVPVAIVHVKAPDDQERLRRAYDLILRAASRAKDQTQSPEQAAFNNTNRESHNIG
jgi:hypothetical protein